MGQRAYVSVVPVIVDTRLCTLWVSVCHHAIPSKYQTEQVREQDTWISRQVWMWTQVLGASECAALWGRQLLEGLRGQGWLLDTMGSRDQLRERENERESVCVSVSLCNNLRPDAQASHWGDWVSRIGYWKDPQCRCLCVSASVCAKEDLGTCTSLGSCVPRYQKLESLGSRGVYCIDSVSLTVGGTHLAYVYLFTLMNLYPYQAQGLRGWGHMSWDFFGAECFYSFWSV